MPLSHLTHIIWICETSDGHANIPLLDATNNVIIQLSLQVIIYIYTNSPFCAHVYMYIQYRVHAHRCMALLQPCHLGRTVK